MDPTSRVADRYLDGRYLEAHPTWHDEDAPTKAKWVLEILEAHPNIAHRSVCDVGCGSGGVLEMLGHHFGSDVQLTGFEPSADAVRIASERRPHIRIVNRAAAADDGPFDVAVVMDVFEHVEDYLGFLRGIQGLAGSYVFHIPLDMMGLNVAWPRHLLELRETLGHLHYFSAETALATLRSTGYDIVDTRFTLVADDDASHPVPVRVVRRIRRIGWRLAPGMTARAIGGISLLVLARPSSPAGAAD